jgi:ComF family protein
LQPFHGCDAIVFLKTAKTALEGLASVLFAAPCRICGEPLTNASRIPVCDDCLAGFDRIVEPMCEVCGRPFESPIVLQRANPRCRLCVSDFYAFRRVRSFATYDDTLAEAIVLLKYEEVTRLGHWFAGRLAEIVRQKPDDWQADIVVPVPLHPERRRERGYNQAELIALPLAKRLKLPLESRLLIRTRPRPAQLVLSRTEHWKSVRGAYAVRKGHSVDNLRVLLIDDVLTTGATLDACARTLKKAGASVILGLTVARVRSWANAPRAVMRKGKAETQSKPVESPEHQ